VGDPARHALDPLPSYNRRLFFVRIRKAIESLKKALHGGGIEDEITFGEPLTGGMNIPFMASITIHCPLTNSRGSRPGRATKCRRISNMCPDEGRALLVRGLSNMTGCCY